MEKTKRVSIRSPLQVSKQSTGTTSLSKSPGYAVSEFFDWIKWDSAKSSAIGDKHLSHKALPKLSSVGSETGFSARNIKFSGVSVEPDVPVRVLPQSTLNRFPSLQQLMQGFKERLKTNDRIYRLRKDNPRSKSETKSQEIDHSPTNTPLDSLGPSQRSLTTLSTVAVVSPKDLEPSVSHLDAEEQNGIFLPNHLRKNGHSRSTRPSHYQNYVETLVTTSTYSSPPKQLTSPVGGFLVSPNTVPQLRSVSDLYIPERNFIDIQTEEELADIRSVTIGRCSPLPIIEEDQEETKEIKNPKMLTRTVSYNNFPSKAKQNGSLLPDVGKSKPNSSTDRYIPQTLTNPSSRQRFSFRDARFPYADPLVNMPTEIQLRLGQITSHVMETLRVEKGNSRPNLLLKRRGRNAPSGDS